MRNKAENSTTNERFYLFVSLPADNVYSLRDIHPTMLIQYVKSKIEIRTGVPGDLIHLFFMNNELADEKTLQDYKLKHGCILRVRLHKTWLGLFIACSKGDTFEVFQNGVQTLKESTQDFDVKLWNKLVVKRATFALFIATYHGYLSLMLDLLNSSPAVINGRTMFGRTALHIAAYQGFVGCVSMLLSEGAIASAVDKFGRTPLQLANVYGHIFCQKRLFMHQISNEEKVENEDRSRTAPHAMMKSFQEKQDKGKNMACDETRDAGQETFAESLPSITNISRNASISLDNCTNPYLSNELPIIDDEIPSPHSPMMRARTAPIRLKEHLKKSDQCSTSGGIRGIEAILKTSQDDVVGEYHNIHESVFNVKEALRREKRVHTANLETKKTEIKNSSNHKSIYKTRVQSHPNKKLLHLVLKVENNHEKTQEKANSEKKEKILTTDNLEKRRNETNGILPISASKICLKTTEEQIESWREVRNGNSNQTKHEKGQDINVTNYSTQRENEEEKLWFPGAYESFFERFKTKHRKLGPCLSHDEWLRKKRQEGVDSKKERPGSALKSKVGQELDIAAFQKWLEGKKKFRRKSKSYEDQERTEQHRINSSAVSFKTWLDQKKKLFQENKSSQEFQNIEKCEHGVKSTTLGGKSFSKWLAEKRKVQLSSENSNMVDQQSRSCSGKTFREWLRDKNQEKQKDVELKEKSSILKLQKKAIKDQQRRLNPRVKTYDEWFQEKQEDRIIELIQSKNVPNESTLLDSKVKYPEDARLVYDMWLACKNMEELKNEKKSYDEMIQKWRKKEAERMQIRRSILKKLYQAHKDN